MRQARVRIVRGKNGVSGYRMESSRPHPFLGRATKRSNAERMSFFPSVLGHVSKQGNTDVSYLCFLLYMHMCTHVRTQVYAYYTTHTCMYTCMCAFMYIGTYTYVHICAYTHIHRYTSYVCACTHCKTHHYLKSGAQNLK